MPATSAPFATVQPVLEPFSDAEILAGYCHEFTIERDLSATLNTALEGMVRNLQVEIAEIFLWRESPGGFVFKASRGRSAPLRTRAQDDDPMLARCMTHRTIVCDMEDGTAVPTVCAPILPLGEPYAVARLTRSAGAAGFDGRDRALFQAMANATALAITNAQLKEAVEDQKDTARDLEFAAEIQRHLLPSVIPGEYPIFGFNRPIRQVSGDFFDFFTLPDQRIAFALGDVSGKGMNAALLMAKAASLYRCLGKTIFCPAEILRRLNREIHETASRGMFVTMVAGTYDPKAGVLEFANAGHEPPLLRSPDHGYDSFPADAPPLGILPDLTMATRKVEMGGGEFFIFSDGLTEFRYGQGEQLGADGLIQMIESLSSLPMAERIEAILSELNREGWSLRDDLTVLAIDDAWVKAHD
jgi:phosphoserine phosphatase RsbU/P